MIQKILSLNTINQLSKSNVRELIQKSENAYREQVQQIVNQVIANGKYRIILLAGPSSSGKTTTSNLIQANLKQHGYESVVVSLDDFFIDRSRTPMLPNGDYDYENVTALDLPYLNKFVNDMFEKGVALMPTYNFITGEREKEYKKVELTHNTMVIIEGLHALNPTLFSKHTEYMYKIYMTARSNFAYCGRVILDCTFLRLMRRLIRDYRTRGMSLEHTFNVWDNVLDGERLYINPYKSTADFALNSTHAYEPLMYASALLPLLSDVKDCKYKTKIANFLNLCNKISPDLIPDNSLLKEFLG